MSQPGIYNYMAKPQLKVTLNSVAYDRTNVVNCVVTRRENAWDIATIDFLDPNIDEFAASFTAGNTALIQVKDAQESAWTTLLRGRIETADPIWSTQQGCMIHMKIDGNGWPLSRMMVSEEYGSQVGASLDTINEIITDAGSGILTEFVEDYADSGAVSGHDFDTQIDAATLTETIRYISFPWVPADKAIDQLLELVQGVRGTTAGAHWLVDTSATPKLYIQPIGSHDAQSVTDGWTNYLNGSVTNSRLVQGTDFTDCRFTWPAKEANYVLYYGAWKYPCPRDLWTESAAASWASKTHTGGVAGTINDDSDAADHKVGANSTEIISEAGGGGGIVAWYPSAVNLALDITKVGGYYNIPTFNCLIQPDTDVELDYSGGVWVPELIFGTGAEADWDVYRISIENQLTPGQWTNVSVPVGPYSGCVKENDGNWADVDWFGIRFFNNGANAAQVHIDGAHFAGYVARVVKQSDAYSSSDPCLMKVVTDDYAKDDIIADENKTGTISKLAYAEYLRSKSVSPMGEFTTPMIKALWPGQLVHTHAFFRRGGNAYRVDGDHRVTSFDHVINEHGFMTKFNVTADVTNTHTRPAYYAINAALAAVRPNAQDMQSASMKMRDIDVTQALLVNTY